MNGREKRVLIIDDDRAILDSCSQVLVRDHCTVKTAEDGEEGLRLFKQESFDVVLLDLKMAGLSGEEVLAKIMEESPETAVIIITAYATIESAVNAIKTGAFNYIPKPFTPDQLRVIVNQAIAHRKLTFENLYLKSEAEARKEFETIVGESEPIKKVLETIKVVGPMDTTVLITGESGTGKELVAKEIHKHSPRTNGHFVVVDCSTLVENLFESELFGHVKGSFTGAVATKYGRFELADGGTIFFDEIANISTTIQAKLLRAIQEREVTRVGSTKVIKVDTRIIAATNKDLTQGVKDGSFREDLFYRLSVVPIHLPPMRERKEDIPLLVNHFLSKFNKRMGKNMTVSETAMEILKDYNWPGNVRELENIIERALVLGKGVKISPKDLLFYGAGANSNSGHLGERQHKSLREFEKEYIKNMLDVCEGNKARAAEILGIDRKTLREKLKEP